MKNYILNDIVSKIALHYYMKILHNIKDDVHAGEYIYYDSTLCVDSRPQYDEHVYHFPDNIDISIPYSIPTVRMLAGKENEIYISFQEIKKMLAFDVEQTCEEFNAIRKLVVNKQKHTPESLIIMYSVPLNQWLILDGRHRYVEYEKFNPLEERVPVLMVTSDMLISAIVNKKGRIAYCVQHNMFVFQNYKIRDWKKNLINIYQYL